MDWPGSLHVGGGIDILTLHGYVGVGVGGVCVCVCVVIDCDEKASSSGWPSGLRRCVQVAVHFCGRGFESHF